MSALKRQGFSIKAIAEHLGRHRSTIYREFNRNSCITLMDSIDRVKRKDVRLPGGGDQGEINIIVMKIFPS